MKATDGLGAMYKKKYCLDDKSTCARYMVWQQLGRSAVPKDLYPNMLSQANKIILTGRK
jgi:hypothetical protein